MRHADLSIQNLYPRTQSAEELANRRVAMEAKGKDAWKPVQPRQRRVSAALKAYALLATSADRGAVRNLEMIE
jgi:dihydroxy-acid dehydratase